MKENSIKDIIEEKYTRYLNCETDIIELTLEEAKFILETGERRNYVTSILQEAGKVLLSDYKRVFKENERYQKSDYETICLENKELKEINERLESENQEFLYKYGNVLKENKELNEKWDKDTHKLQNDLDIANAKIIELLKENEELKEYIAIAPNLDEMTAVKYRNIQQDAYIKGRAEEQQRAEQIIYENYIPIQKVKDIIDRIDYDIKKTKEIISKNTNIYASYRKKDYQIVRLRAMNTKSLDIKKRLQKLLESEK